MARHRTRMMQRAAAKQLGISNTHLSRLEHGSCDISLAMLERMNELYDTDVYVQAKEVMMPKADAFEYINNAYRTLYKVGTRVKYTGGEGTRYGTVTGTRAAYVRVKMDGDNAAKSYHPTWKLEII